MGESLKDDARALRGIQRYYSIPGYLLIVFGALLAVSILVNVKFLFLKQPEKIMNVPVEGRITESDAGQIVVEGAGNNMEGFRGTYRIYYSDQIKVVNEKEQNILFQDLKPGMYVEVRLWTDTNDREDRDVLSMVTWIKCSETREGLDEKI